MVNLSELEGIARREFADIIIDVHHIDAKLRMILIDGSFIDFWWSEIQEGRFAHHWNRQHLAGQVGHILGPYKQ